MDPENKQVDQDLKDDDNDVDVYGSDDEDVKSVDSFDLDDTDEEDFDSLDDLEISDDDEAVDGRSVEGEADAESILSDLESLMSQLRAMVTGEEEEGELELGDEGEDDEVEFSLDGEEEGDDLPGEDDSEIEESCDDGEELEESNGSLEKPAPMNKDGIVDTKTVTGGNESAKIKSNSKKAKALPKGKKPDGKEAVEDPKEIADIAIKAGKGTKKTNLPTAQSVLQVAQQMLSGNSKVIQALYSGKTLAKEAFDNVEYKVDGRTLKAITSLDESLSDDFKTGMVPVFERAVEKKVRAVLESMVPLLNNMMTDEVSKIEEKMVKQADAYIEHVVENYFNENRQKIEEAQTARVSNGFLQGLRALFEAEAIDVPVGKEDLVEKLEGSVKALSAKNTALNEDVRKYKAISIKARKEMILHEASEDLSMSQGEKLRALAEKQTGFKSLREFRETVDSLKSTLVESTKSKPQTIDMLVETVEPSKDSEMTRYANLLSRKR